VFARHLQYALDPGSLAWYGAQKTKYVNILSGCPANGKANIVSAVTLLLPSGFSAGYIFGVVGTIERECVGLAPDPEAEAFRQEMPRQPLYRVRFSQMDVWDLYTGERGAHFSFASQVNTDWCNQDVDDVGLLTGVCLAK
jgi:hypothetical protein